MLSEDTLQLSYQILACLEDLLVGGERHGSVLFNNLLDRVVVGKSLWANELQNRWGFHLVFESRRIWENQ